MSITHVQSAMNNMGSATGVSSVSVSFSSAVGSGNTVIGVYPLYYPSGSDITSSITDDKGNSYSVIQKILWTGGTYLALIFFRLINITNGPTTITVHFSSANAEFSQLAIDEFSGVVSIDGFTGKDQSGVPQSTDAVNTGSMTPTGSSDYLYCSEIDITGLAPGAQPSTGTSFTLLQIDNGSVSGNGMWGLGTEGRLLSGASAVSGTWTPNTAGNEWISGAVLLSPTSAPFTASLSETASAAEAYTISSFLATASLTESASAADSPAATMRAPVTLTEAASAADTPSVIARAVLTEAGSAADSPTVTLSASVTLSEHATAIDTPTYAGESTIVNVLLFGSFPGWEI